MGGTPQVGQRLVSHTDMWHYHKGTNAAQSDWKTVDTASLNSLWAIGGGGFGYEDGDDNTRLADMMGGYSTLYIRRTFEIAEALQPSQKLLLTMDYDDGFIAWVDGYEIGRSSNLGTFTGAEPAYNAVTVAGQNHEASAGEGGNPPITLTNVAPAWLTPGQHVLAVMGLNASRESTDFSLIADLTLTGSTTSTPLEGLYTITRTNQITLAGSNTYAGSVWVTVNAREADFNPLTGIWTHSLTLNPGVNRLYVAALGSQREVLGIFEHLLIYEATSTSQSGSVTADTTWNPSFGVIRLTNNITVPSNITLRIEPGTVLLLSAGASLQATTNGTLLVQGDETNLVWLLPANPKGSWGEVGALGTNATATLSFVEIVAGQVRNTRGGTVVLEDCVVREMYARQMLEADHGRQSIFRRCHIKNYAQAHMDYTPVLVEDCLFENITSDAMDFEGAPADIQVLRTTWRYGSGSNTDALDLGLNDGVLIEDCLIHDFPDKGVSIADNSRGTRVRNSLFYRMGTALSVYNAFDNTFENVTIAASANGLHLYERTAGQGSGHATATNLVLWGNSNSIVVTHAATLALSYSDAEGSLWPGTGNLNVDPLFTDPAKGDYSFQPTSPILRAGLDGQDMGAKFPIGGIPSAPVNLSALSLGKAGIRLAWKDEIDNEDAVLIRRSTDGVNWEIAGHAPRNATEFLDTNTAQNVSYLYQARATNRSGLSRWSNPAAAAYTIPSALVGGVLPGNTTWSPDMGVITVVSNLTVPTDVVLRVLAGTQVKVENDVWLRTAPGGTIEVLGEEANEVVFSPRNAGQNWGELSARGAGARLLIRHADISGAQVTVQSNAAGVIQDSYLHHYRRTGTTLTQPILLTHFAAPTHISRCYFTEYYETLFRNGVVVIEDCLFEHMTGDALDLDSAQAGTVLRRNTFRHGTLGNVDAVDVGNAEMGGSRDVLIESCLMYDFPYDKGVSIGDSGLSTGTTVSNCLIYNCLSGIMAKDGCIASVRQCTIVSNRWGFTNYYKLNPSAATGGGHTSNTYNNILYGNAITMSLWNGGTLTADHNLFSATNWLGEGNFDANPRFISPATGDYRLAADSPCLGSGRDGADLGAHLPVGSILSPSHPAIVSCTKTNGQWTMLFWADHDQRYTIEATSDLPGPWAPAAVAPATARPQRITVGIPDDGLRRFFRLKAVPAG